MALKITVYQDQLCKLSDNAQTTLRASLVVLSQEQGCGIPYVWVLASKHGSGVKEHCTPESRLQAPRQHSESHW